MAGMASKQCRPISKTMSACAILMIADILMRHQVIVLMLMLCTADNYGALN